MYRAKLIMELAPLILLFLPVQALADDDPYHFALQPRIMSEVLPKVGDVETVTPGDRTTWTQSYRAVEGAHLSEAIAFPTKSEPNLVLPVGTELYRIESSKAFKACTVDMHPVFVQPCLIDDEGEGQFDRIAKDGFDSAKPLPHKIPYSRIPNLRLPAATTGFTRELLYQGATADTLKFGYREFTDDLARPAFTEDLSIPISKRFPQQVALKGLVLTIFEIGPLGMKYRLDRIQQLF